MRNLTVSVGLWCLLAANAVNAVTIGIVTDGPTQRQAVTLDLVQKEVSNLLGSEFDEVLIHSSRIYRVLVTAGRRGRTSEETGKWRDWIDYYLSSPYMDQPERFFSFPRKPPQATILEEKPFADGTLRLYAIPSGYRVRNPDFRDYFQQIRDRCRNVLEIPETFPIDSNKNDFVDRTEVLKN